MNTSRKKFVIIFLVCAFAFQFIYNSLFGPHPQFFAQKGEPFLETDKETGWKRVGSTVLLPIKIVLLGPALAFDEFLRDDPPPPFVAAFFIFYWSILALVIHYILGKLKRPSPAPSNNQK